MERLSGRQKRRKELAIRGRIPTDGFDWSDAAFLEADDHESRGIPMRVRLQGEPHNGFEFAKRAQDITIQYWKEDIRKGLLFIPELLSDGYSLKYLKSIGALEACSSNYLESLRVKYE